MDLNGYVRVSTADQKRFGISLEQQPERLRAYCGLHDHRLVNIFVDKGISASVPLAKRPGGCKMLRHLRANRGQGVAVVSIDRLFRSMLDGLEFFQRIAPRLGVSVHSVSELVDTSTSHGRLLLHIMMATAEYDRDLDADRASACNRQLKREGKVYGGIPYGCVELPGKRLARDPVIWDRREYIVGLLERGQSLRSVQAALSGQGVPSPTGKSRWSIERLRQLRIQHKDLLEIPFAPDITGEPVGAPDTEVSADA